MDELRGVRTDLRRGETDRDAMMGGMGGMVEALGTLLQMMGIEPAPWMGPVAVLAVVVLLSPLIVKNLSTGQARKLLKDSRVVEGEARKALEDRALEAVDGKPAGLVAVVEEAHKMGRAALAAEALRRLKASGGAPLEVRRLARLIDPEPLPSSPAALGLRVEKLRTAGLHDKAERQLKRGLKRWPADPWLVSLSQPAAQEAG